MIHLKGPEGPIELNPVDGPMGWEWNGASARPVSEDVIEVSWGGRTLQAHVAVEGDRAWVNLDGHVLVFDALLGPTNATMEGGLTAPMPGVVLDVHVAERSGRTRPAAHGPRSHEDGTSHPCSERFDRRECTLEHR